MAVAWEQRRWEVRPQAEEVGGELDGRRPWRRCGVLGDEVDSGRPDRGRARVTADEPRQARAEGG